jgi:hypothetical protein
MSRKIIVLGAICLALLLSAAVTLRSRAQQPAPASGPDITQAVSNEVIAGYRKWTRVNHQPQQVPAQVAQLCAPAFGPKSPHGSDKYITVYVNETGRHAMMEEKTPHFPQGSVIVKEKLTDPKSTTPELLTVMVKRERGYNPESGDWEYMIIDGNGLAIQERGKLENCQTCHLMDKNTDYVSRNYLPAEIAKQLK